ncbi:PREDICTED: QWRF motif-containing protein 2-like [Brassica oleracea var. oleracea]|uniref:QWRF motif-containing protein 2 n=1 Tax=Brassica oleracea var. oleracea TaxID=109376 RepID=A0A0D3BMD3_BRAOL|nr:PREDICTED: QWRF motif-containing protein 2-like [Brassica oleracea var. oleracea]
MVAGVISGTEPRNPPRDRPNNVGSGQRRPTRGKQVPSRYLSPSPSHSLSSSSTTTTTTTSSSSSSAILKTTKRHPSPLLPRPTNSASNPIKTPSLLPKRSQSVDRRRPSAAPAEVSAATKMLITSTRSLSVSFQGEAFSLPVSKKKEASPPVSHRRSTPARDQRENSKPVDQHRWPGASRRGKSEPLGPNPLSRSRSSVIGVSPPRVSINGRLSLDVESGRRRRPNNGLLTSSDVTASDTDSVSSGSTNGEVIKSRSLSRNVMASPSFWQETNTRLRRLQDPGSPSVSSPRGMASSPVRGGAAAIRSASPSKLWATTTATSPARALSSPCRVSDQMNGYNNRKDTPSILSFSADIRRGKIGGDRVVDAHLLRLLYNRYLQWRFVNARADSALMVQRLNAEKNLWNAWVSISELRHSVTLKRIKLLLLKQKLKLASILRGQMGYLEEWSLLDRDHSSSLSGATQALKASTLRLPIVGKTVVDIKDLKHAVSSAVDVMQAMSSPIFSLTLKVDEMNSVMVETVNVTAKEKVLLERCQGFLSRVAAMQVTDCSVKTHIIQLRPITSSLTS